MKAKENTPELTKTEKLAGSVEKFFSKNGKVLAIVAAVVLIVVIAIGIIVTVNSNKSEKEFSDTTRYEDYSINESLFHWQSQSTTSDVSKTGRRYITQNQTGGNVLIFVRAAKKKGSRTLPYTFLGTAHYVSHEGSRPISIIYHLDDPIPARYITLTDSSGVL